MKPMERPRAPGTGNWRDAIKAAKGPFAAHAAILLQNGYSPVQIIPGTKSPFGTGWDRLRSTPYTLEEIETEAKLRPAHGIGVMGCFGGMLPIDIDTDNEAINLAVCSVLPAPLVAKKGQKGYTTFLRAPDGWEFGTHRFTPPGANAPIVEVLGKGKTVLPPTVHPDLRRPYEWLTPATLFNTRIEALPQLTDDFMEALTAVLRPWCPEREVRSQRLSRLTIADVPSLRIESYARTTLHKRADEIAALRGESGRNVALFAAVSRVGNWVHHGYLSEGEMHAALHAAYETCGGMKDHGKHGFESTVRSGMRMSANDPLWIPEGDDFPAAPLPAFVDVDSLRAEALRKSTSNVIELQAQAPVTTDDFIFDDEFTAIMPPALIRGLLPRNGLVIDGGQSGAGKTFAEVDMAVALASGEDWFGQPCRECVGVVYIAAEGQSSIQRRFIAAKRYRKLDGESLPIAVPNWNSVNLRNPKVRALIIKKLLALKEKMQERYNVRLGAIVLDTVSSTCPMKDENSNAEVAIVCVELREIADALDVVLIAVHHFGKAEDSGLRGGSAWRANCDHSRIFLARRDGPGTPARDRKMAIEKNRLGPEGETIEFDLNIVSFGQDVFGDSVTECAIAVKGAVHRKPKLNAHEEDFVKAYREANFLYRHTEKDGLRPDALAVPVLDVREIFMRREPTGQETYTKQWEDAKRQAWSRAFKAVKKGLFKVEIVSGLEWSWPAVVL